MKKIVLFISKNRFIIAISFAYLILLIAFILFIQSFKKDQRIELLNGKIKAKEELRLEYIKQREVLEKQNVKLQKVIDGLREKDSVLAIKIQDNQVKINSISKPKYIKEKFYEIDNKSDSDLYNYFMQLPEVNEPNDY